MYFEKETINGDDFDATDDNGEGFHCGLPEEGDWVIIQLAGKALKVTHNIGGTYSAAIAADLDPSTAFVDDKTSLQEGDLYDFVSGTKTMQISIGSVTTNGAGSGTPPPPPTPPAPASGVTDTDLSYPHPDPIAAVTGVITKFHMTQTVGLTMDGANTCEDSKADLQKAYAKQVAALATTELVNAESLEVQVVCDDDTSAEFILSAPGRLQTATKNELKVGLADQAAATAFAGEATTLSAATYGAPPAITRNGGWFARHPDKQCGNGRLEALGATEDGQCPGVGSIKRDDNVQAENCDSAASASFGSYTSGCGTSNDCTLPTTTVQLGEFSDANDDQDVLKRRVRQIMSGVTTSAMSTYGYDPYYPNGLEPARLNPACTPHNSSPRPTLAPPTWRRPSDAS